jgi:hypothetical protein
MSIPVSDKKPNQVSASMAHEYACRIARMTIPLLIRAVVVREWRLRSDIRER